MLQYKCWRSLVLKKTKGEVQFRLAIVIEKGMIILFFFFFQFCTYVQKRAKNTDPSFLGTPCMRMTRSSLEQSGVSQAGKGSISYNYNCVFAKDSVWTLPVSFENFAICSRSADWKKNTCQHLNVIVLYCFAFNFLSKQRFIYWAPLFKY